ncbi:hypothetical protein BJF83_06360 [Nocardiopsis sp. CNR-923]|uniref:PucR family transcriptional regulator n=1 Tax=Nocardiopsis sp. CNR-923 TaxID=1904965 RepID=UPI00095CB040|nr:PucR family transcriptional regulator [Nocardiopsis sp. CNR-923]OLT24604.1 hypothetical protein BJF83_06360 [Nocardiopsis sp. CNR-923]
MTASAFSVTASRTRAPHGSSPTARTLSSVFSVLRVPPAAVDHDAMVVLFSGPHSKVYSFGHLGTSLLVPPSHRDSALSFLYGWDTVILLPITDGSHQEVAQDVIARATSWIDSTDGTWNVALGTTTERGQIEMTVDDLAMVIGAVERLGQGPGIHRVEDMPMEIALMRSPDLAALLASRLIPLMATGAPLLETLVSYIEHGRERSNVARQLHIHPNTLDYRLRRIHELTGLSPWVPKDLQMLGAASLAARLMPEEQGESPETSVRSRSGIPRRREA